jgi:N-hydroxyarylamine O-acetyltransferase
MEDSAFDTDMWLRRIGLERPLPPTVGTLHAVVEAHATTIPFENIDVLLGRVPLLDLASLQRKIVIGGRGGYCFELNTLLRAGLTGMGFQVTGLIARVIRGLDISAQRPATHMVLRIDLPEGAFVADVGFGAQTPTAALAWRPGKCRLRRMSPPGFCLSPTNSWCRRNAGRTGKTSIAFHRGRRCRPTMRSQTGSARRTPPAHS